MWIQITALVFAAGATLCLAAQPATVHVLFRTQQLREPEVPGTPTTISESFHPWLITNVVTTESHRLLSPLDFYSKAFGPKPVGIEWMFGMEVLRYQPHSTNFVAVERFRWKELKSDTNFVSRLQDGDVLFFHGHVD